jgi:predicted transposase/invertase (TIGR01784 family)
MAQLSQAYLEWEQKTKQEERQEGRQEVKITIATNLLQQGFPIAAIARATGLTIAQLHQLQAREA